MTRLASAVRRLPIRVKLALISVGVMSVVMLALGLFLYFRFEDELDTSIDQALAARAVAGAVLANRHHRAPLLNELSREEGFGEVVTEGGRVLTATTDVGRRLLIPRRYLAQAANQTIYFELRHLSGISKHARLIARPIAGDSIIVVGTTLKDRERANESLARALLFGMPFALLLAILATLALIRGALRPVEQMRVRAATISAAEADARLPLPEAQDEISRLGETLNEMLARLQQAFARERAFVADASHELRTPLAILKTELELASRGNRTNGELQAAVASAAEEVDRLTRLAEDLLVLARADDGQLPVRLDRHELAPLVHDVAASFGARAAAQSRAIGYEVPDGLTATIDPERIRQALGNLVDNALTHGTGDVCLSGRRVNGDVELHVEDAGPGFPEQLLDHAFERFTRGDPARGRGGSGLGLAIVDAIARGHGGSAHARNTAAGSDVWLRVPAQSSARRSSGSTSQSPPNSTTASAPATTAAVPE